MHQGRSWWYARPHPAFFPREKGHRLPSLKNVNDFSANYHVLAGTPNQNAKTSLILR